MSTLILGTIATDAGRAEILYDEGTLVARLPDGTLEYPVEQRAIPSAARAYTEARELYVLPDWDWQDSGAPLSLDDLLDVLAGAPEHHAYESEASYDAASRAYAEVHALPVRHGELDWTDLPVFGGAEPSSTVGVWSWDATRLLVGEGRDLRIVDRAAQ